MKKSPTEQETEASLMRSRLSEKILRSGFGASEREELAKIFLFEGENCAENYMGNFNLKSFTEELFCAVALRMALCGRVMDFSISGEGTYHLNIRLYEIALLRILKSAKSGTYVRFSAGENFVWVSVCGIKEAPEKEISTSLGEVQLFERKSGVAAVFIPLKSTASAADENKTEHLWHRYSVVDAFIY